jgi:Prokaryotic N-terminal methylation motif
MKTCILSNPGSSQLREKQAFTFVEMMITVTLFMLMMGGVLYAYLFGIDMYQITKIKLGASDDARKSVIKLTDEIRSGLRIRVGSGSLTNFIEVGTNAPQIGNAIQIYPDTNVNNWIRYYYDTNKASKDFSKLCRTEDGVNHSLVIAHYITNTVPIFSSEDSYGVPLTNNMNNRIISMTLQFYQIEYPIVKIGPGQYYDFYQLRTRITRRSPY